MNSKSNGNIGEAVILAEFTRYGIQCSIPWGDNARYDLIAEFNGKLNKIQIKYCDAKISENDSYVCSVSSSTNHTTNKKLTDYSNDVDYIAIYIKPWNKCLLIPISFCGSRKTITFRNGTPKNKQIKKINYSDDFLFSKILCVETLHDQPKP